MQNREEIIHALRSETLGTVTEESSLAEAFQNQTLRPILKLQNDLFIATFHHYFVQHKNVFYQISASKKITYLNNIFNKDQKFLAFLKGLIVAMFSMEEYATYAENTAELNKRMMTMLYERIKSQLDTFEGESKP